MTTGKRTSEVMMGRLSYRPEQSTLIENVDSPSLVPRAPTQKDRALLTLLTGPLQGTVIQLDRGGDITLGRSKQAMVLIPDPSLSRIHARLFRRETPARTEFYIEDCGSTNGTFVEGHAPGGHLPVRWHAHRPRAPHRAALLSAGRAGTGGPDPRPRVGAAEIA